MVKIELVHRIDFDHSWVSSATGGISVCILKDIISVFAGRNISLIEKLAEGILCEFEGSNWVSCLIDKVQCCIGS